MKKGTTHIALLLATALLLYFPSCFVDDLIGNDEPKTEESKLPEATQEGLRTFGCLIDGKAWLPNYGGLIHPPLTLIYSEIEGALTIRGNYHSDSKRLKWLGIAPTGIRIYEPGVYDLTVHESIYMDSTSNTACMYFENRKAYFNIDGTLEITKLDFTTGIISGTFSLNMVDEKCLDTIRVTLGRFDGKYK